MVATTCLAAAFTFSIMQADVNQAADEVAELLRQSRQKIEVGTIAPDIRAAFSAVWLCQHQFCSVQWIHDHL